MNSNQELLDHLMRLRACGEARTWIEMYRFKTPQEAWDACLKPAWMMWYLNATDRVKDFNLEPWVEYVFTRISKEIPDSVMVRLRQYHRDFKSLTMVGMYNQEIQSLWQQAQTPTTPLRYSLIFAIVNFIWGTKYIPDSKHEIWSMGRECILYLNGYAYEAEHKPQVDIIRLGYPCITS